MIVNIDDIKTGLRIKNIEFSDEELADLIQYNINKIIGLTGVNLDVETYHYTITDKRGLRRVVLPLNDIFDVDEVHVDFELYDDSKYFVDNKNGVIFFKEPILYCEHLHIKYLTKPDDNIVSSIITPLVTDMIINDNDGDTDDNGIGIGGEISSIHEGGVSISFKANSSLQDSINKRLDKLANGEISLTGKQTKKGAYYI